MIGLDTNILARYYIQDQADKEAEKQHFLAKELIEAGEPLMVCTTVFLELEWIMRGYYQFSRSEVVTVFQHLCSLPHVQLENAAIIQQAINNLQSGFDFADALHHACYKNCDSVASFDNKKFAKRSKNMGLSPIVFVPTKK